MKKKKPKILTRRITIRVPDKLFQQIMAGSELIGVDTPSAFIRVAVRTFLKDFGFRQK